MTILTNNILVTLSSLLFAKKPQWVDDWEDCDEWDEY
ncbi:hypothetical protein SAMN05421882_10993 [Nitrosomonas communis]|uniref:Uncharacterized protein n=1 Tax=Nitrosomonas communis TaxID=44574 RepID=A0A1H2ZXG4_9PROT|nr:hypothetical protein SAMN05421882_10993 [Nitrosomonas communis]